MLKSRQALPCKFCGYNVRAADHARHVKSYDHEINVMKHFLSTKGPELTREKEGLSTLVDGQRTGDVVYISCITGEPTSVDLEVFSKDYDMKLDGALLLEESELLKVKINGSGAIPKGGSCIVTLSVESADPTLKMIPLAMKLSRDSVSLIRFVRYIRIRCGNVTVQNLEENVDAFVESVRAPQLPPATKIVRIKISKTVAGSTPSFAAGNEGPTQIRMKRRATGVADGDEEGEGSQTASRRKLPLKMYPADNRLRQLHLNQMEVSEDSDDDLKEFYEMVSAYLKTGITSEKPENYDKYMQILLHCEDIQQEADIRMYDQTCAKLKSFDSDPERFELEVEGLQEGRPSLLPFDNIYVRFSGHPDVSDRVEYEGFIHRVKSKSVEIIMGSQFFETYYSLAASKEDPDALDPDRADELRFGVRFSVNRRVLRLMHRALAQVETRQEDENDAIEAVLIPQKTWPARPAVDKPSMDIELVNENIRSNPEQFTAVQNIVRGLSRPLPYIVFGPPGTGKTTTIAESILQVYKMIPRSRILIAAPSNSAVNVVTGKVLASGVVAKDDIYRFYGASCKRHKVPVELERISNYDPTEDTCHDVDMEILSEPRIVACTLSMSGNLVTLGFEPGHFTHLFIDEAGHAMEPEALIPIAGLLKIYRPGQCDSSGCLVLSGDPLQLGPIIRSPIARMYQFGRSFLERLMDTAPYRRQKNNAFNPIFLAKLVRNFRSHDILLSLPNKLFYDDELTCHGDRTYTHAMVDYERLPERGIPLIFHGVHGTERREARNPSFYNPEEVSVIEDYVVHLLTKAVDFDEQPIKQEDIGIISPYRQQVLKIRRVLSDHGYTNVTVGSTEEFQGQERLVMLLSTVRSDASKAIDDLQGQTLGFLKNQKRFNVATTRAKALLIVVGDPNVLKKDYCWRNLINLCRDLNACRGISLTSSKHLYEDLHSKIEALNLHLGLEELRGRSLAANGQVAITEMTLQEEPQWRDEE